VFHADLARAREAMRARLGDELPVRERMRLVAVSGLNRVFDRSDRLALAMRARCLSWNATLPRLRYGRLDAGAFALAAALLAWALATLA
jgi:biotin transport system permease protein